MKLPLLPPLILMKMMIPLKPLMRIFLMMLILLMKLLSWPPRSFLSGPFMMGGDLPPGRRDARAVQIRVCSLVPTVCLRPGMDIELCCTVDPCPIIAIEH